MGMLYVLALRINKNDITAKIKMALDAVAYVNRRGAMIFGNIL
jgi:hypothetical protein